MKLSTGLALLLASTASALVPRNVKISDQQFITAADSVPIVMRGPNIVVKGPPYLPAVEGTTRCDDKVTDECMADGSCSTCSTFNQADIDNIKAMGWNTIRLGVVWAGAQPEDTDSLDADFVSRLHAILDLTDANGIHVILDNHGDMVSSAGCGNGVPMWFSQKATPDLIGKPLTTGLPYSLVSSINVKNVGGYDTEGCGADGAKWAEHAGDPNYNLLNECCQAMNSDNPPGLGYTNIAQGAMDYMVKEGQGRQDFVRYWRLLVSEVVDHPSAFAAELMNEPMTIRRRAMYATWKEATEAINAIIPDMSVAICDIGEGAVIPDWVSKFDAGFTLSFETTRWLKSATTIFYAWHWYGQPSDPADAVKNVQSIGNAWNVPTFLTEFMSCDAWNNAQSANISISYWHYSAYCDTGKGFGDKLVPDDTFGACILGWGGGNSQKTCDP
jgi:hypothetical protein